MGVPGGKKLSKKIADEVCQYMNRGYAVGKCSFMLRDVDLFGCIILSRNMELFVDRICMGNIC